MPYTHLTEGEREEISRGLAAGETLRGIADRLGRDPGILIESFSTTARDSRPDIRFVMDRLNTRPRKVLDFQTPLEVWKEYRRGVALTT